MFSLAKAQRRGVFTGRPSLHLCGFARAPLARSVGPIFRAEPAESAEEQACSLPHSLRSLRSAPNVTEGLARSQESCNPSVLGGGAGVVRTEQSYEFSGGMGILPMILHGRDARATMLQAWCRGFSKCFCPPITEGLQKALDCLSKVLIGSVTREGQRIPDVAAHRSEPGSGAGECAAYLAAQNVEVEGFLLTAPMSVVPSLMPG